MRYGRDATRCARPLALARVSSSLVPVLRSRVRACTYHTRSPFACSHGENRSACGPPAGVPSGRRSARVSHERRLRVRDTKDTNL